MKQITILKDMSEGVTPDTPKLDYEFNHIDRKGFAATFTMPAKVIEQSEDLEYAVMGSLQTYKIKNTKMELIRVDFFNLETNTDPIGGAFIVAMLAISTVINIVMDYSKRYNPDGVIFNPSSRRLEITYLRAAKDAHNISNYIYRPKLKFKGKDSRYSSLILLRKNFDY